MSIDSISRTINGALAAAGLRRPRAGMFNIATTIRRALAAAGLSRRQRVDETPWKVPVYEAPTAPAEGRFIALSHKSAHGARDFKLYVPAGHDAGRPMPLVVMLHGCKQGADDFAAGTRMNEHAQREGFLVAYPEQTRRANGANCWNWFEAAHQARGGDEPALIAGIVGEIAASHAVDPQRVFVAGLSAGASMALILGAAYPELFAGVAAHSGLPVGSARDVASAFAAMRGQGLAAGTGATPGVQLPTIVFHGDADATVVPANGNAIVEQAVQAFAQSGTPLQAESRSVPVAQGLPCTATAYRDSRGRARVEEWVVHGGAHAWSGGSDEGSYTDGAGPDASAEIVRFFLKRG